MKNNQNMNNKKSNFLFSYYNNNINNNNNNNNIIKNSNANIKIFNGLRNIGPKKNANSKKIKSKSTEKLNIPILGINYGLSPENQ